MEYAYSGLETTIINDKYGKAIKAYQELNEQGQKIKVRQYYDTDSFYEAVYTYHPFGEMKDITVGGDTSNEIAFEYDIRGNQTQVDDPNMGVWTYTYNAFGELVTQTDAKGQVSRLEYDVLGRVTNGFANEGTTSYEYGSSSSDKNVGQIIKMTGPGKFKDRHIQSFIFDSYGRPSSTITTIGFETFTSYQGYDSSSRLSTVTYPSGFAIQYNYTTRGYLDSVANQITSTLTYFDSLESDDENRLSKYRMGPSGSGYEPEYTYYSDTGLIQNIDNSPNQEFSYVWDAVGNLESRTDLSGAPTYVEAFEYDNLNRLSSATVTNGVTTTYEFAYDTDGRGNLVSKGGITQNYGENGARVNQVSSVGNIQYSYDDNGNLESAGDRIFNYTSFNKPRQVLDDQLENTYAYGINDALIRVVSYAWENGKKTGADNPVRRRVIKHKTTYVGGGYEVVSKDSGVIEYRHYISDGSQPVAIYTTRSDGTSNIAYLFYDHLGSVSRIENTTDLSQDASFSFDPWGLRRETDMSPASSQISSGITSSGYTGHIMLGGMNLIHMQGRVYDPTIARFLSADPVIQDAYNIQNLNRYSYVINNPLKFIDPTGFDFVLGPIRIGGWVGERLDDAKDAIKSVVREVGKGLEKIGKEAKRFYIKHGQIVNVVFKVDPVTSAILNVLVGGSVKDQALGLLASTYSGVLADKVIGLEKYIVPDSFLDRSIRGSIEGGVASAIRRDSISLGLKLGFKSGASVYFDDLKFEFYRDLYINGGSGSYKKFTGRNFRARLGVQRNYGSSGRQNLRGNYEVPGRPANNVARQASNSRFELPGKVRSPGGVDGKFTQNGYTYRIDTNPGAVAPGEGGFHVHVFKSGKEVAKVNGRGGFAKTHGGKVLSRPKDLHKTVRNQLNKLIRHVQKRMK